MRRPPLASKATSKLALLLFLLVIVFNALIMPGLAGKERVEPIDIQFAYSPEKAYSLIESYGDETRAEYRRGLMTLDVLYPVVYTLFISIALMVLFPGNYKLAWAPYFAFAVDIFENAGIVTMLSYYPEELRAVAIATSIFTTIKWILALILVLILLYGVGRKFFTGKKELS